MGTGWTAKLLLVLAVMSLGACVSPAKNVGAPPALVSEVRAQSAPSDKARVHFFHGLVDSPLMIFGPLDNKQPADLIANGAVIGGVNVGQVLVVDIEPGDYQFAWGERVGDGHGMVSKTVPLTVRAGELVYLRADWSPSAGAAFGVVGALAAPPGASLVVCSSPDCFSKVGELDVVVAE